VHSYFDLKELETQMPIQNNGKSAQNIAQVCRDFLAFKGKKEDFMKTYKPEIFEKELSYD
jgi:hypothetical protein